MSNKINKITPIRDHILVTEMNFGERTLGSGIIMLADDKKTDGIRPRWAKVYAIGPEQKEIKVGQWVLVDHGRWTRGSKITIDQQDLVVRRIDNEAVLLLSDTAPITDDQISTALHADVKER